MKELVILEFAYGVLAIIVVIVMCVSILFQRKTSREIDGLWSTFRKQVDFNDAVCKSGDDAFKSIEDEINFLRRKAYRANLLTDLLCCVNDIITKDEFLNKEKELDEEFGVKKEEEA